MDAEEIIRKARQSISQFCIEECKSYCCRRGYLTLKENEVDTVTQGRRQELIEKRILKKLKYDYSLFLGDDNNACPCLKDFKCIIHESAERPKACGDFPLFVEGNLIKLSPRCLAVKTGMLYPYIKKLLMMGYKLKENHPYSEMELDPAGFPIS
jgi:Fe-S-cluster containining protein